jgi:hypothetical protein
MDFSVQKHFALLTERKSDEGEILEIDEEEDSSGSAYLRCAPPDGQSETAGG